MNFIASVLITITESEESAFLVLMHMLIDLDMRPIFLPVSPIFKLSFLGSTRAAPKKFSDSIAYKVPYASFFRALAQGLDDPGLFYKQVVHDHFLVFFTVWVDRTDLWYVHIGRMAVSLQGRNRAAPITWADFNNNGHDRDVHLLPWHSPPWAVGKTFRIVSARFSSSRK